MCLLLLYLLYWSYNITLKNSEVDISATALLTKMNVYLNFMNLSQSMYNHTSMPTTRRYAGYCSTDDTVRPRVDSGTEEAVTISWQSDITWPCTTHAYSSHATECVIPVSNTTLQHRLSSHTAWYVIHEYKIAESENAKDTSKGILSPFPYVQIGTEEIERFRMSCKTYFTDIIQFTVWPT